MSQANVGDKVSGRYYDIPFAGVIVDSKHYRSQLVKLNAPITIFGRVATEILIGDNDNPAYNYLKVENK